jgi:threonylcarbamoyladenosine tRNA methylthiotransferase MtaB
MSADRPLRAALTALGCKVNYAEMAELAGALAAEGIEVVPDDEPADIRVLNSCTVTLQADATTRQRLARLRRIDPTCHLVLTGCSVDGNPHQYLATAADGQPLLPSGVDAVFANVDKPRIAEHLVTLARRRGAARMAVLPAPALRTRGFLKVQDGCDHRCTYCTVWRARGGRSISVPPSDVLRRAAAMLDQGHRELVLSGVDLGAYGQDLTPRRRLADLVEALLPLCGSDARLRLSSVNANDIDERLAELTAHPRLCSHWHIPLQSGSDSILRAMHRGYRSSQYRRVVGWLRHADGDTELTTDIMVGFPAETDEDHRATVDLVGELEFLHCHVFRYSPRPGTPAADLRARVDDATARQRSRDVRRAALRSGLQRRRRTVGRRLEVLWEAVENGTARGRSSGYHAVVVADERLRAGTLTGVRISAVEGEELRGTVAAP